MISQYQIDVSLFVSKFQPQKTFFVKNEVWDGDKTIAKHTLFAASKIGESVFISSATTSSVIENFALIDANQHEDEDSAIVDALFSISAE